MPVAMVTKVAVVYSLVAGVLAAAGNALLSTQFWQGLIVAAVTGLLAGAGTIIGSLIATRASLRHVRPVEEKVDDVKRQIGANRRATDD